MKIVYIGIGSNLGDREENLRMSRERLLKAQVRVLRESAIYETAPRDFVDQPWFLNQVVEAETDLLPLQLLGKMRRIEKSMGRRKIVANGPRIIDLDILLYGRAVIHMAGLDIPHPRMAERRFVLEPLGELAPELKLPRKIGSHDARTIRELLAAVADQEVRRWTTHLPSDLIS